MKKITLESTIAKQLVKNADYCNAYIAKKDFPEFYTYMESLNNAFYAYYIELEKDGEKADELKENCFQLLRNFLSAVGKVNGDTIKCGAKTGENSTLFLDCVAYCHKQYKSVKSTALASAICNKSVEMKNASKALEKGDINAYKAHKAKADEYAKEIATLQAKKGNATKATTRATVTGFARAFEERLRAVMLSQLSKTPEQIKAEKDKLNAERKARRNASKQAPKAGKAKAPESKQAPKKGESTKAKTQSTKAENKPENGKKTA